MQTSSFWRSRHSSGGRHGGSSKAPPAAAAPTAATEGRKIVGAAYSHADMLKFDALSISSAPRPRTPPSGSHNYSNSRQPTSTSSKGSPAAVASPPRKAAYSQFTTSTAVDGWDFDDNDDDNRGGYYDGVNSYDYGNDENEDEFGLPSLAGANKKTALHSASPEYGNSFSASGGSRFGLLPPTITATSSFGTATPTGRRRANSSDIAEERGLAPSYPKIGKSEGKILRPQYKEILRDPANALNLISHPPRPTNATPKELDEHDSRITRINKFKRVLQATSVSLSELRNLAWNGIPEELRPMSWQLLLGYLPTGSERRASTLERKRKEYVDGIQQAFERNRTRGQRVEGSSEGTGGSGVGGVDVGSSGSNGSDGGSGGRSRGLDEAIWHQISIDVPRTNPHLPLYGYEATQRSLERILYLWAIRHPASGYVQGINDLVTPFWQVFLGSYITDADVERGMDPGQLPRAVLDAVEADAFWCLSKLLDGIQDNYIFAQPGILRQVAQLRDLTMRIDAGLARHLEAEGVQFIQFSFRWMNCLLMREFSVRNTIRMWDTYMAEEQGFSQFHIYVCAAFLVKWSEQLVKMDFQEIMMFLQALPTRDWTVKDIELLLSEAFIWQSLFRDSSAHLRHSSDAR